MTLEEQLNGQNQYLRGEPTQIGNDMFLVHYKEGKTGKVSHYAVMKWDDKGSLPRGGYWRTIGKVTPLYGYRKGRYNAWISFGDQAAKTWTSIESSCPDQQAGIAVLVKLAQSFAT